MSAPDVPTEIDVITAPIGRTAVRLGITLQFINSDDKAAFLTHLGLGGPVIDVVGLTGHVTGSALKTALAIAQGDVSGLTAALALLAPAASPTLTGTPLAPTANPGTSNTQLATTAFVAATVAALIDSAPGALDTLKELADAMGDDANFAATVTTALAGKQASLGFTPENVSNKSTNIATDAASDTKYPSAKAVKAYVDANAGGAAPFIATGTLSAYTVPVAAQAAAITFAGGSLTPSDGTVFTLDATGIVGWPGTYNASYDVDEGGGYPVFHNLSELADLINSTLSAWIIAVFDGSNLTISSLATGSSVSLTTGSGAFTATAGGVDGVAESGANFRILIERSGTKRFRMNSFEVRNPDGSWSSECFTVAGYWNPDNPSDFTKILFSAAPSASRTTFPTDGYTTNQAIFGPPNQSGLADPDLWVNPPSGCHLAIWTVDISGAPANESAGTDASLCVEGFTLPS